MSIHTYSGKVRAAGKSGAHPVFSYLLVLALVTAGGALCDSISTISSPSGQQATDSVSWAQLGSDQATVGASFNVTSAGSSTIGVSLAGANSIASVVCGTPPSCSWTGAGFNGSDTLLWTSDAANGGNGPVTLTFPSPTFGAGAYIQADALGAFTANAQAYNASGTLLGTASIVSGGGNAVYVGVLDTSGQNVKSVVFSVSNCSNGCSPADFAIDTVQISGSSNGPVIQLSPTSLNFGNQTVGTSSSASPVTLKNVGGQTMSISSITTSGDYSQTNNCGSSLTAGGQCTVNVTFTPSTTGTRGGTLTVSGNASNNPGTASLTGVGVSSGGGPTALQFVPVTPCRIADTRGNGFTGQYGPPQLASNSTRNFTIGGVCGIPSNALAYSLNVTVVPPGSLQYLTIWPAGQSQPTVSTLNSLDGRYKANAAIVPAGSGAAVSVYVTDATQFIIDTDGYFIQSGTSGALAFYPLTPCRIADTRTGQGFSGSFGPPSIGAGASRSFPINPAGGTSNSCTNTIPTNAQAYSLNITAIPSGGNPLVYITVWPTGQGQPTVSTLNAPTGTIVANAALVPGNGTNGAVSVYASNSTDLLIDIDGYFAAPGSGGLSLYTVTPCRVIDTRNNGSPFSGTLPVPVAGSCGVPSTAKGYVFNATVVPPGALTYLTLWPDGQSQPVVSTLNALDGAITSNMAIVPNIDGTTDAYASNPTQLILDISSYFAP